MITNHSRRVSFQIASPIIRGPFDLYRTMRSGQTAEPEWKVENDALWDGELFDDKYLKLMLRQMGSVDKPTLQITVIGEFDSSIAAVNDYLMRLFDLTLDLEGFYAKFQEDPLVETFQHLRGLRLMRAANPFESLICSISSQYSTIRKWNSTINLLKQKMSKVIMMGDGSIFHPFPRPEHLAKVDEKALRACGFGYRARYIREASRMVAEKTLELESLAKKGYVEAKKILTAIPGVGPKVADCFLLYGLGFREAAPVDIWMSRIVSHFYLYDRKASNHEVEAYLHRRFGKWAGLAHLYLYCYARDRLKPNR